MVGRAAPVLPELPRTVQVVLVLRPSCLHLPLLCPAVAAVQAGAGSWSAREAKQGADSGSIACLAQMGPAEAGKWGVRPPSGVPVLCSHARCARL